MYNVSIYFTRNNIKYVSRLECMNFECVTHAIKTLKSDIKLYNDKITNIIVSESINK